MKILQTQVMGYPVVPIVLALGVGAFLLSKRNTSNQAPNFPNVPPVPAPGGGVPGDLPNAPGLPIPLPGGGGGGADGVPPIYEMPRGNGGILDRLGNILRPGASPAPDPFPQGGIGQACPPFTRFYPESDPRAQTAPGPWVYNAQGVRGKCIVTA